MAFTRIRKFIGTRSVARFLYFLFFCSYSLNFIVDVLYAALHKSVRKMKHKKK